MRRKPAPSPPKTAEQYSTALVLFAQNLEAIRVWYRCATYAGREVGHVVMQELVLTNVTHALTLALEGKRWSPPHGTEP